MRKITPLILSLLITATAFAGIKTSTAWFNAEAFDSYTLGADMKTAGTASFSGWTPSTSLYVNIQNASSYNYGSASGNFLGFTVNNVSALTEVSASGSRTWTKTFTNALTGYVYGKTSFYTSTGGSSYSPYMGTGYYLRNSSGSDVFMFGGYANTSNALFCTGVTNTSMALGARGKWADIEFILDITNKKVVKMTMTYNSTSYSATNLDLPAGTDVSTLYVYGNRGYVAGGLDNTTIGQLVADNIKSLAGASSLQTLSGNNVTTDFNVTSFTTAMSQDLTIAQPDLDIQWSISDYGTLSTADKALVSITRNATNFQTATLTAGSISADATITVQAVYGSTTLTKTIDLKALSVAGLKSSLAEQITASNTLLATVTDSNPFIISTKSPLQSSVSAAQAVIDNSAATITEATTAISNITSAQTSFSSNIVPYNDFLTYITTVQTAYNAEVRTATFFTTIKATLNTALTNAATARTTMSSTTDITTAKTALQTAYTQFTTDLPAYSNLETQITTVTSRLTAVTPRIGDDRFLMFPTATVGALTTAKTTATDALANSTTASQLTSAQTALTTALATFNAAPRVAPVSSYYKIYTYGVDNGDGGTNKMILYADANDSLKYAAVGASVVVNSNWQINETSTGVYNLVNIASGKYLNGMTLSTTAADFTLPEGTSQSSLIAASSDTYFLYYIVNSSSKALEVDSWNSSTSCGKFTNTSAAANRFRFCYQFEPVTSITSLNQTATSVKVYSQNQNLVIDGLKTGERYTVYNMLGSTVASGVATASTVELKLRNGIYLVNAGNNIFKFVK
ncbi:MAG: hypothetical protein RIS29_899 [Bacteroidota bacterium]|jgi:hypothetical protein